MITFKAKNSVTVTILNHSDPRVISLYLALTCVILMATSVMEDLPAVVVIGFVTLVVGHDQAS